MVISSRPTFGLISGVMGEEDSVSTTKMLGYREAWRTNLIPNKVAGVGVRKRGERV